MFDTTAETTGGWTNKYVFKMLSVLKFAYVKRNLKLSDTCNAIISLLFNDFFSQDVRRQFLAIVLTSFSPNGEKLGLLVFVQQSISYCTRTTCCVLNLSSPNSFLLKIHFLLHPLLTPYIMVILSFCHPWTWKKDLFSCLQCHKLYEKEKIKTSGAEQLKCTLNYFFCSEASKGQVQGSL